MFSLSLWSICWEERKWENDMVIVQLEAGKIWTWKVLYLGLVSGFFVLPPSVLTVYTLTSVYKFSILYYVQSLWCLWGEFGWWSRGPWVCDHLLNSHELNVWFMGDIVRRNWTLATLEGWRVLLTPQRQRRDVDHCLKLRNMITRP